jgi:branched-chain amino acid transport system ATP-binding protein
MTALLDVQGLDAGYEGVPVVRQLSLHVHPGELVALLGPNGAGKTTTLLTISGLLKPLSGEIQTLGRSAGGVAPQRIARRGVAHVPEDRGLFFDLTVRENLRLASRNRAADLDQVEKYFPALMPLVGRRAGLLSGGEQQMLALARAITSEPKLLLVDEMSLGLAPIVVERLLPVLRRIADERGCGILLVEQYVHLVLGVADRAYVLSHGDLVLQGAAADVARDDSVLESSYLGDRAMG